METSDSECFESADEDFQSDEEDTATIKSTAEKCDVEKCKIVDLDNLRISPKTEDIDGLDNNKNNDLACGDVRKEVENNANVREISTRQSGDEEVNTSQFCKTKLEVKTKTVTNKDKVEVLSRPAEKKELSGVVKIEPKSSDEVKQPKIRAKLGVKTKVEVSKSPEILEKETNKSEKPVEKVEDNLWDDTEINWGEEAKIDEEFSTKTVISKKADTKSDVSIPKSSSSQDNEEENMWGEDEDWEPVGKSTQQEESSWGTWGNWGVTSILNTATQGVSTLTQGISTVLESGIGVPDPEDLARINKAEKEKLKELDPTSDEKPSGFGLGNLVMGVSHLTKLVESTGTKVISGGLDTLETIGKKTMEVLQEGDPGLKKKRAFLKIEHNRPVLSQVLREAKEKAEQENKLLEQKHYQKRAKNYETLFDDHQGLVHLEALEMLSKQCDIKLQTMLETLEDEALVEMQETMDQVKELCELPDEDDDEQTNEVGEIKQKLESAVAEISIPITYKRLIETWDETESWLNMLKLEICDERELHQQAIETLAQLTAIAVEQFHKSGELLLVKERRSTADEADSLVQLTTTLTSLIGLVAAKFSDKLNTKGSSSTNKEQVNSLITNVFFEAANSSSYIQDAFQLLIPVLQVGAL